MRLATIFFLILSIQATGQDTLNDVTFKLSEDYIQIEFSVDYQWGNLEIWNQSGKLVHTATLNPKSRFPKKYLIPKADLIALGCQQVSVFVTRLHKGMVFRDNVSQIQVNRNRYVQLRSPSKK